MAIYCAVQSPIPGNAWSAVATASGSSPGSRSICRRLDGPRQRDDALGPRRGDAQPGQLARASRPTAASASDSAG